jgi:hypothetical protein
MRERWRAACGILGPAAFTAAWVIGTTRQPGYSVANEHISGLAALDARSPGVMTGGFLALGSTTVVFASELDRRLTRADRGPGVGPLLMGLSGIAVMAAGVLRRDHVSNYPSPGEPTAGQSRANDGHDIASVISHAAGSVGMLALAVRFRDEPQLRGWTIPATAAAIVGTGLSGWFAREVTRPGNGLIQRTAVSIPLGFEAALAWRLLREAPYRRASPGIAPRVRSTSSAMAATRASTSA